ncbi:MAG: sigma-70 family RNA polymerase sigma factor [Candidatus Eisenbacteria bacterium]|nr:sigma-70 family RNA polymerase sigma factor [Candidatus Eisenbacteria bacterium]
MKHADQPAAESLGFRSTASLYRAATVSRKELALNRSAWRRVFSGEATKGDGTGGSVSSTSDADLVAQSQRGNLEAFNSLALRWNDGLYRFIRRTLGNDEDARDICQEALVKAYQNIGRLRDPEKFRAWIHHIALNLCRDWYRSARRRREPESYDATDRQDGRALEDADRRWATDHASERRSLGEVLHEIMEGLPLDQRTAILLREYQGFTSQEIAQITGVPAATVRTRIFYGLKSARKMLQERGITTDHL